MYPPATPGPLSVSSAGASSVCQQRVPAAEGVVQSVRGGGVEQKAPVLCFSAAGGPVHVLQASLHRCTCPPGAPALEALAPGCSEPLLPCGACAPAVSSAHASRSAAPTCQGETPRLSARGRDTPNGGRCTRPSEHVLSLSQRPVSIVGAQADNQARTRRQQRHRAQTVVQRSVRDEGQLGRHVRRKLRHDGGSSAACQPERRAEGVSWNGGRQ